MTNFPDKSQSPNQKSRKSSKASITNWESSRQPNQQTYASGTISRTLPGEQIMVEYKHASQLSVQKSRFHDRFRCRKHCFDHNYSRRNTASTTINYGKSCSQPQIIMPVQLHNQEFFTRIAASSMIDLFIER